MKLTLQLVFVVFDAHTKFCDNMVRFSLHCLTSGFFPQTQKTRYDLNYERHNSLWQWVNHYHKWLDHGQESLIFSSSLSPG